MRHLISKPMRPTDYLTREDKRRWLDPDTRRAFEAGVVGLAVGCIIWSLAVIWWLSR